VVSAQKVYFLYLQTDDQSPFYVRMADKIFSSSTAGYLILPNLTDSTYQLGLGFAKSSRPETKFAVTINQSDKGYLIKNFTDELSLFDLQELSIVKSVSAAKDNTVYETRTDKFSSVLSKAADDPGLLKVPVAKKEEVKPKTEQVLTAKVEETTPVKETPRDTVINKPIETAEVKTEKKEEPIKTEVAIVSDIKKEEPTKNEVKEEVNSNIQLVEYKPSKIVRRSESSTTEGFGIVFYDKMQHQTDTIRILIPPSKIKIVDDAQNVNVSVNEKVADIPATKTDALKTEIKTEEGNIASTDVKENKKTEEKTVFNQSQCKASASDKDFMKLRKNMAAKENDEAMIDEAKKIFKNKCFSVEQVRYLSTLFLTSAAKYQFFDASFKHVSDKENFSSLQQEIKDEYYLKRFKALAGE
jgi:hypothetical protein